MAEDPSAAHMLLLAGARIGADIVAVGERGAILRSSDNGRSWLQSPSHTTSTLTGISFAPLSHRGWAVGHQSTIIFTADGGRSWKSNYEAPSKDLIFLDVLALDTERVFAVGAFGLAMSSRDGGHTWTQIKPTGDDLHLNRISAGTDGTLYIAGEKGLLLRSSDSGATWEKIPSPYEGSFFGILPLEQGALLTYGLRGHVFRSENSDSIEWRKVPSESTSLLATALRMRNGTIILAGQARCFLVSRDGGRSFSPWEPGLTSAVAELLQTDEGTLLAFGEAGVNPIPSP